MIWHYLVLALHSLVTRMERIIAILPLGIWYLYCIWYLHCILYLHSLVTTKERIIAILPLGIPHLASPLAANWVDVVRWQCPFLLVFLVIAIVLIWFPWLTCHCKYFCLYFLSLQSLSLVLFGLLIITIGICRWTEPWMQNFKPTKMFCHSLSYHSETKVELGIRLTQLKSFRQNIHNSS